MKPECSVDLFKTERGEEESTESGDDGCSLVLIPKRCVPVPHPRLLNLEVVHS